MRVVTRTIACFTLIALLSGCSYFSFPGVHKITIQQGNIINQEMVNQLQPGMTKSQVRFVMGTPLIADTFNQNRWDYFYSLIDRNENEVRERLVIYFEGDKLARISGDFVPNGAATTAITSEPATGDQ